VSNYFRQYIYACAQPTEMIYTMTTMFQIHLAV